MGLSGFAQILFLLTLVIPFLDTMCRTGTALSDSTQKNAFTDDSPSASEDDDDAEEEVKHNPSLGGGLWIAGIVAADPWQQRRQRSAAGILARSQTFPRHCQLLLHCCQLVRIARCLLLV